MGWGVDVDSSQNENLGGSIPIPTCKFETFENASLHSLDSALRACPSGSFYCDASSYSFVGQARRYG